MNNAFITILLIYLVIGGIVGYLRGLKRSLLRLGFVILSAVMAFLYAKPLANSLLSGYSLSSAIDSVGIGSFKNYLLSDNVVNMLDALPVMICSLFCFAVVFLVAELLMYIPQLIFNSRFPKEKLFGGMGVSIVCGLLCFILTFAPAFYFINLAQNVYEAVPQDLKDNLKENFMNDEDIVNPEASENQNAGEMAFEFIDTALKDSTLVSAASKVISPIVDSMTKITIDGEKTSLSKEVDKIVTVIEPVINIAKELEDISINSKEDVQKLLESDNVNKVIETISESKVMVPIVDSIVDDIVCSSVSSDLLENEKAMDSAANLINDINDGNDNEDTIKKIAGDVGYDIPDVAADYLEDYVKRNFSGNDWDADSLKLKIEELKNNQGN